MPFEPPLVSDITKLTSRLCMSSYGIVGLRSRMTFDRLKAKAMMQVNGCHVIAR